MDLRDQLQQSLGSAYTLGEELSGGGMSRVFTAEETALGRKVVVKVLPSETAAQVSVDRFKREIQVAARLQHPHIVPLFAAGDIGGQPYFTMPFIDGESLRARLARSGELPITDATRILRDVASALAYAHERDIVHRDIKPDNVLLMGGSAMVTDFGVAKALTDSSRDPNSGLTSLGIALGTPAYMAPEQALAEPTIDHRADIYGVGVLAYELLTGHPPFSGRTAQNLLAAHISETPEPVSRRRQSVPPALAGLVMRCLEKRPADRVQSAQELVHSLDDLTTPSGGMSPAAPPAAERSGARSKFTRAAAPWLVAAAAIAFSVLTTLGSRHPSAVRAARLTIPGDALADSSITISPDGNLIAYESGPRGERYLHIRSLADTVARRLEGIRLTGDLRFTPDSKSILFQAGGSLQQVSIEGGVPTRIVDTAGVGEMTRDCLLFTRGGNLWIAERDGSGRRRLATGRSVRAGITIRHPTMLPDGKHVLVILQTPAGQGNPHVGVVSLTDTVVRELTPQLVAHRVRYHEGRIFVDDLAGAMRAVAFSLKTLTAPGEGTTILPAGSVRAGEWAMSDRGDIVFLSMPTTHRELVTVNAQSGEVRPIRSVTGPYRYPRVSPDGKRVAVTLQTDDVPNRTILINLADGETEQLVGPPMRAPEWSDDGRFIFTTDTANWVRRTEVDVPGQRAEIAYKGDRRVFGVQPLRDGKLIVRAGYEAGAQDLGFIVPGSDSIQKLAAGGSPRVSPDERWLAFTNGGALWIRPLFAEHPAVRVAARGQSPYWDRTGNRLYYVTGLTQLHYATLSLTREPKVVSTTHVMDVSDYLQVGHTANFSITHEGLFVMTRELPKRSTMIVLLDWIRGN